MALVAYFIPIDHSVPTYNAPKYFFSRLVPGLPGMEGVVWAWETYLLEDIGLIVAEVTPAQDTLVSGQADVFRVPNLDITIPNATERNRFRDAMENYSIPGTWITTDMEYRAIVRTILGMFQIHNRMVALLGQPLFRGTGWTLAGNFNQVPPEAEETFRQAARELNVDVSTVVSTTTLREAFKIVGDQFASRPFQIGALVI